MSGNSEDFVGVAWFLLSRNGREHAPNDGRSVYEFRAVENILNFYELMNLYVDNSIRMQIVRGALQLVLVRSLLSSLL